ncbi:MAG TPA: SDR family oxidoreductase [Acidimicrobiia bacterium]|jgi:3-oxoacyl-[acyl-carrier protein] reductase|nr:SDR family oxidoreductase [Acidimicrobiia bacterium]
MDLGISGKRAAVAAASQGLGFGTAQALVAAGVQVAICARRQDAVDAAVAKLGGDTVGIVADVGGPEGASAFVEAARAALGGVDILVANAGGPPPATFETATIDQYAAAFDLNCRSTIAMCQAALPAMREQGWGRVVAITSIAVRQPIANLILSNTARAGVTGFLKTLAREVARDGVTVNSLQPGLHATERLTGLSDGAALDGLANGIPVGFLGTADDFGAVAAFLCSVHARYITGAAIPVDGGSDAALM